MHQADDQDPVHDVSSKQGCAVRRAETTATRRWSRSAGEPCESGYPPSIRGAVAGAVQSAHDRLATRRPRGRRPRLAVAHGRGGRHRPVHGDERRPEPGALRRRGRGPHPVRRIVVQGGVTSAILNAVVAEDLPGPGTVFLETHWRFLAPDEAGRHHHRRGGGDRRAAGQADHHAGDPGRPRTTASSRSRARPSAGPWTSAADRTGSADGSGTAATRPLRSSTTCTRTSGSAAVRVQ